MINMIEEKTFTDTMLLPDEAVKLLGSPVNYLEKAELK